MEQKRGTALKGVNIIPRNNNVLLRMEYNESILALRSDNPEASSGEEVTFTVAAIGPMVNDLELGERVLFNLGKEYIDVPVKGNNNSIRELKKFYSEMKPSEYTELVKSGNNKVGVIQYGMFTEFEVKGHIE